MLSQIKCKSACLVCIRADSIFALSQWETALRCNVIWRYISIHFIETQAVHEDNEKVRVETSTFGDMRWFLRCGYFKNLRSMLLVRAKGNITDKYIAESYPFRFKSNRPSIPKKYGYFKIETKSDVKVMGEVKIKGHEIGPTSNQTTSYQLTSILSFVKWPPVPEIQLFENLTLKIQSQCYEWDQNSRSHNGCNNLSTHKPFVCQSAPVFLRHGALK